MLDFSEDRLVQAIGGFGIGGAMLISSVSISGSRYRGLVNTVGLSSSYSSYDMLPGQTQAFLTSNTEFVWFIEHWKIIDKPESDTSFDTPVVTFTDKKLYPAKVQGLSLALLGTSNTPASVTVRWRDGLIRHSNLPANSDLVYKINNFRPGFGQNILSDLQRPLQQVTVQTNNLGILGSPRANSQVFWGPLGRILSMAFYVDPEKAAEYDKSINKKKKKSLNSQDYEQIPTYPAYTPYVDNSGY